ncbi:MAG: ATP-dependent DNA helicase RecG [Prevotellaceae bacterium]|jgi:ATP-dependent DNA helicase RecG|nr:ATP-dependent DNA helicase RecG [Prevotellaceae bacterium]
MLFSLDTNIQFINGVGPRRAALLKKEIGIETLGDLITFYPFRYIDRSRFWAIREVHPDMGYVQLRGRFTSMSIVGEANKRRLVMIFTDGIGEMEVVFFKGISWIQKRIVMGNEYTLFGKVSVFHESINMVHPEVEPPSTDPIRGTATLQALYPSTEALRNNGISQKFFSRIQADVWVKMADRLEETLPAPLRQSQKLVSKTIALKNIHFPESNVMLAEAQRRLKFEELFYIQLDLLKQKSIRHIQIKGARLLRIGAHFHHCFALLPFELTNAQKRVIKEIRNDVGSGKQMNRLLQGDVGSGKTLVALLSALIAIDNGLQACIMVPTEILAQQHFASISKMTAGGPTVIGLLTGSTKASERKMLAQKLLDGSMHLLIGTHALIEEQVQFSRLGFVVIDEQHRFGVDQRARLWAKNPTPPHILVMTATPIPRTLAMTLYGDLDVSVIDQLPPGRQPIKSLHFHDSRRTHVYGFMKEQIEKGHQIYVVYPLIKESEKIDFQNLEQGYQTILQAFPKPAYQTSVVHGQQKAPEKASYMELFAQGKTDIMVATSVIEVGVDVPNASVMVIESAERFGLSQLHQLRGRVGRGPAQSYCILLTGNKLTKEARQRMELMCATNDGFEIAEADLRLRGPGDMEGTQQSGLAIDLKIANIAKDGQLLELARRIAQQIIDIDPQFQLPENKILIPKLQRLRKNVVDYSRIS